VGGEWSHRVSIIIRSSERIFVQSRDTLSVEVRGSFIRFQKKFIHFWYGTWHFQFFSEGYFSWSFFNVNFCDYFLHHLARVFFERKSVDDFFLRLKTGPGGKIFSFINGTVCKQRFHFIFTFNEWFLLEAVAIQSARVLLFSLVYISVKGHFGVWHIRCDEFLESKV